LRRNSIDGRSIVLPEVVCLPVRPASSSVPPSIKKQHQQKKDCKEKYKQKVAFLKLKQEFGLVETRANWLKPVQSSCAFNSRAIYV
jgi:hypothetical protein